MPCVFAVCTRRANRTPSDTSTPGSLVGDVDRHGLRRVANRDRHRSITVGRGVVDEHSEHLADRGGRSARPGRRLRGDPKIEVTAVQGQTACPLRRQLGEQRNQVERLDPLVALAGQREQLLDRRLQAVRVDQARADRGAQVPVRPLESGFEAEPQARERCPQLVRCVGGERPFAREQVVEPAGGVVQGAPHRVDLRYTAPSDAHAEVAVAQPARADREILERARQASGLPARDEPRGCRSPALRVRPSPPTRRPPSAA